MRRAGQLASIVVIAAFVASVATAASLGGKKLPVSPASGGPHTTFHVTFTAPEPTASGTTQASSIHLSVTGPKRHAAHCLDRGSLSPSSTRADERLTVALRAGGVGWCVGTFSGSVEETIRPVCSPHEACPQYIALDPIGGFRFVVRATRTSH
jgi:hypothetical protein